MAWLRIDDHYPEHPKVVGLSDRAFRLHTAALCYCARNLTDGHLDRRAVNVIQAILDKPVSKAVSELIEARLWLDHGDRRYEIHGFLEKNPSAQDVKTEREQAAERMRDHRARKKTERTGERDGERSPERNGERSGTPSRPVPQRTNPKAVQVRDERPQGLQPVKDLIDSSLKGAA